MKSGKRFWGRLVLLLVGGAVMVGAGLVWQSLRSVEALFSENRRLHESLARLQEESVLGHLWLVSRSGGAEMPRTTFVWVEPGAAADGEVARVETLTTTGKTVYLDGFAIRFPPAMVADGRARNLFFWRRAFGDGQAPNDGVLLDDGVGAPARYESLFGEAFSADEATRFWSALWELAHDSEALGDLGIHAIHGNAVSIEPRPEFLYTVRLSATGALSIEPVPLNPASLGRISGATR